ncbi:membrane-associating domain-containing protein [Chaetomium fimeti]|uniref:Membrane-associating domain-containing protein n=1 Tax=Chaetomium fimeti TaxID=1854472 RepID=A0AAE0HBA0_9PEZI|nr:membrane-associating domain-containing protein [Chaetomium fimeti]
MKLANMSFSLMLLIRVCQGVFALLVLILSGFVANWYRTTTSLPSPSQINFLLFGAIWSFISLACIEILPRFLPRIPKPYIAAPLDLTNALFHLAGFAALAAFLSGLLFCHGDVCHTAQAAAAFSAFSFAVWSASAVLTCLEALKIKRGAGGGGGGVPAGSGAAAATGSAVKEGV